VGQLYKISCAGGGRPKLLCIGDLQPQSQLLISDAGWQQSQAPRLFRLSIQEIVFAGQDGWNSSEMIGFVTFGNRLQRIQRGGDFIESQEGHYDLVILGKKALIVGTGLERYVRRLLEIGIRSVDGWPDQDGANATVLHVRAGGGRSAAASGVHLSKRSPRSNLWRKVRQLDRNEPEVEFIWAGRQQLRSHRAWAPPSFPTCCMMQQNHHCFSLPVLIELTEWAYCAGHAAYGRACSRFQRVCLRPRTSSAPGFAAPGSSARRVITSRARAGLFVIKPGAAHCAQHPGSSTVEHRLPGGREPFARTGG
jgi:hypothetical protein